MIMTVLTMRSPGAPIRRRPWLVACPVPEANPSGDAASQSWVTEGKISQKSGAGDGNRTHDIQLGKLSFYH
jgi:hypothetical protein